MVIIENVKVLRPIPTLRLFYFRNNKTTTLKYWVFQFVPVLSWLIFLCSCAAPVSTDDAWGSAAPPSDSSPSGDPFGDGASKKDDPWGAPSSAPSNGTGKMFTLCLKAHFCDLSISHVGEASASLHSICIVLIILHFLTILLTCVHELFPPFSPFHLHLLTSISQANNLNQLNFSLLCSLFLP